jgi:uncharacterized membrane protein YwaF
MKAEEALPFLGPDHSAALLVTGLAAVIMPAALRRAARPGDQRAFRGGVCRTLAVLLILNELINHTRQVLEGVWTIRESLPLHLCGLGIYVAAAALWLAARREQQRGEPQTTPRAAEGPPRPAPVGIGQVLCELTYYWGLGGSVQALLTPEIPDRFPSIAFLTFFFGHGAMVVSALTLALGLGCRPRAGSVWRVWWITLGVAVAVFVFNLLTGSNYMYLMGKPDRPSLYDFFGPWPWALLTLVGVATVLFWLLYLPFWLAERRAPQRLHLTEHGAVPGA